MDNIIKSIIILLLYVSFTVSQTGWERTQISNNDITAIEFTNVNTGFAIEVWYSTPPGSRLWRTINGGINWNISYAPPNAGFRDIFFINQMTGYLSAGFIHKTTDGGNSWFNTSGYVPAGNIFFINEMTGWCSTYGSSQSLIYMTSNGGINWIQQYNTQGLGMNSVYFTDPNTGYAVDYNVPGGGSIFKTTNASQWVEIFSGTKGKSVFFASPEKGFVVGTNADFNSVIMRTTNYGSNWNTCYTGPYLSTFNSVFCSSPDTVYVCGDYGIIKSTNSGINWIQQNIPVKTTMLGIYFINNNIGFCCGTFGNILRTTTGGVTSISQISSNIPEEFKLYQNYPNPFNPGTKIRFELSRNTNVKISIYDVSGKEILLVTDSYMNAGIYSYEFNASKLASGIYFYRLDISGPSTGSGRGFTDVKKMILLK